MDDCVIDNRAVDDGVDDDVDDDVDDGAIPLSSALRAQEEGRGGDFPTNGFKRRDSVNVSVVFSVKVSVVFSVNF